MTFVIDDAFLPATLTSRPMSDEEFSALCAEHPEVNFEMTVEGEIIVMAPTHSDTGARNFEVAGQLRQWAKLDGRGIGCDSSTGFVLPNGARRSPDTSWTLKTRAAGLGPNSRVVVSLDRKCRGGEQLVRTGVPVAVTFLIRRLEGRRWCLRRARSMELQGLFCAEKLLPRLPMGPNNREKCGFQVLIRQCEILNGRNRSEKLSGL